MREGSLAKARRIRCSTLLALPRKLLELPFVTASLYQPFPMQPGHRAQAWRHQPAFLRPRHFHEEPELNLVTRGTATFGRRRFFTHGAQR
jgi:hypothetical protein